MAGENFQIYVYIPGNAFASYKIEYKHFYLVVPPGKILPQVIIITPKLEGNYSFLPQAEFFQKHFLPSRKGCEEETM